MCVCARSSRVNQTTADARFAVVAFQCALEGVMQGPPSLDAHCEQLAGVCVCLPAWGERGFTWFVGVVLSLAAIAASGEAHYPLFGRTPTPRWWGEEGLPPLAPPPPAPARVRVADLTRVFAVRACVPSPARK